MAELSAERFMTDALAIAHRAASTQLGALQEAAELIADALSDGRGFYAAGTGHSHALAEEIYGRAGGLLDVRPILEPSLMLHEGLEKSSVLERLPGLGRALIDLHRVSDGDVVLVASNSGRNAVPVELAEAAKDKGARVIALTSRRHTDSVDSRAPSGAKLADVADVVLDNCGVPGDAMLPNDPHPVGPTSTMVGAMLLQALIVEVVGRMRERGTPVPTYLSLNV